MRKNLNEHQKARPKEAEEEGKVRMKIVKFTARPDGYGYGCSEPNDQSGEYVKAEIARDLLEACEAAREALNLWTLTYAPEFCEAEAVKAACERLYKAGGTIAFISELGARLQSPITKAEGQKQD